MTSPRDEEDRKTFYLGSKRTYTDEQSLADCEKDCGEHPDCMTFTYFSYAHPSSKWASECVGKSTPLLSNGTRRDPYATSGTVLRRLHCKLTPTMTTTTIKIKLNLSCRKLYQFYTPTKISTDLKNYGLFYYTKFWMLANLKYMFVFMINILINFTWKSHK